MMVGNEHYLSMSFDWQPDEETFMQLAHMTGLIEKSYLPEDVGEFVAYWFGRAHVMRTPYQWNLTFVQNMKRKRTAFGQANRKVVGTQLVTPKAELVVDDNTRQLRDKYGKK
jgi:hypothetical protein